MQWLNSGVIYELHNLRRTSTGRGKTCNRTYDTKEIKCHAVMMSAVRTKAYKEGNKPRRKSTYTTFKCPYCLLRYEYSQYPGHCGEWNCRIADKRCKQWGVKSEEYQREFQKREAEQRTINMNIPNKLNYTEKISCIDL